MPRRRDPWVRRYALLAAGLCAATLVVLAIRVHGVPGPLGIDVEGDRLARAHPFGLPLVPLHVAQHYLPLGTNPDFAVATGLLVVAGLVLKDQLGALVALIGPPLALAATEWVTKPLVGRHERIPPVAPLQHRDGVVQLGFPSGHTTAAAALIMVLAVLIYRRWGSRILVAMAPVVLLVPLAMVGAVVRLRTHVLSDGLGGVAVGYGTVLALAAGADAIERSRPSRRPLVPEPGQPMPASDPHPD